jgi:hypothetical protein
MKSDRAFALLERENPVDEAELPAADDVIALLLRERILSEGVTSSRTRSRPRRPYARRSFVGTFAAGASLAIATAVAALFMVASPSGGPAVDDAAAAVKKAARLTAASAKQSGTAVVWITKNEKLWAQSTIRWNGRDLSVSSGEPESLLRARSEAVFGDPERLLRVRSESRLVDGVLYAIDPEAGGWVVLGSPESIDPDSGTTPDEYLAAVREDVGGATLRRLTDAMTGLKAEQLDDGSTVYSGTVAAGEIARESGFKEGHAIRVLPFGYVAQGEGADPAAAVDADLTVGADGVIRNITVT